MEVSQTSLTSRIAAPVAALSSPALLVVLLGFVALLPRVLGLADFITTDEAYHWIARTERFADAVEHRRWGATLQTGHPGVTVMWLGTLGLAIERVATRDLPLDGVIDHLAWLRLPSALLQALLVPAGYLLLRRLVTPATAFVAALLWATSPYLVAHARLLHLDALLTSFVTFSLLLAILAVEPGTRNQEPGTRNQEPGTRNRESGDSLTAIPGPRAALMREGTEPQRPQTADRQLPTANRQLPTANRQLPTANRQLPTANRQLPTADWKPQTVIIASGLCAGLALLTKGPALILLPCVGLLFFWMLPIDRRRHAGEEGGRLPALARLLSIVLRRLAQAVPLYLLWLGTALLVVMALWPALWVDPAHALRRYVEEISVNGGRPNGDGQFFLGRAVDDPGPLFYLVADLFRMTPATLLGLMALPLALRRSTSDANALERRERRALLALAAFALFWTLVMTLGPKKFDRYVLPTWPAIEMLAAAGLVRLAATFRWPLTPRRAPLLSSLLGVLLLANLAWYHPYYLSYYNPLLGGGAAAQRVLLIGWGEGMDQVGAYLRSRPDITHGPVLSALAPTLQPFVPVPVKDVTELRRAPANYAVVYLESLQRAADPQLYAVIQQTIPLHQVTIHGIAYAHIYQLPHPFERAVLARFGEALRLRGVSVARDAGQLVVTPAWDVRAPPAADYHVFLHLIDANGRRVAQIDVAPGGGDAPPTSAWQPGQQIAVPLPLPLPADLPAGEYQLVMGVYDAATGARLPLLEGPVANPASAGAHAALLATLALP